MPQQPFGPWILAFRAALAVVLAISAGAAHACVICFESPEETLNDRVWAADAVVLARPGLDALGDFTLAPQVADCLCRRALLIPPRPSGSNLILPRPGPGTLTRLRQPCRTSDDIPAA